MRNLFIMFALLFCGTLKAQIYTPTSPTIYGSNNLRLKAQTVLHLPVSTDSLLNTSDTSAQIRIIQGELQYHYGRWIKINVGPPSYRDTFADNFRLVGIPRGLEKWADGDIVPAKGLTAKELILLGSRQAVPPTYNPPTATISTNPGGGSYEYGTNIGFVTLTSDNLPPYWVQNDAGSLTNTYFISSSGSNTISSLTNPVGFYATKIYAQGACKPNNLGDTVCSGRIEAGSINTNSIVFSSYHKRYLGFSSTLQGDGTPSDANVLSAYYIDNSGGSSSIGQTAPQQTSSKYLFFVTTSPVTSVSINGFPSTDGFNLNIQRAFTNAVNGSYTYYFTVSKNPSFNASTTAISIN